MDARRCLPRDVAQHGGELRPVDVSSRWWQRIAPDGIGDAGRSGSAGRGGRALHEFPRRRLRVRLALPLRSRSRRPVAVQPDDGRQLAVAGLRPRDGTQLHADQQSGRGIPSRPQSRWKVAGLCVAQDGPHGSQASRPGHRRRTVGGRRDSTRRHGIAPHARCASRILVDARFESDRVVASWPHVEPGSYIGTTDGDSVLGGRGPTHRRTLQIRVCERRHDPRCSADSWRAPLARWRTYRLLRTRQALSHGQGRRCATPPDERQRWRALAHLVARWPVHRMGHLDGSRRRHLAHGHGRSLASGASHHTARLLRRHRLFAERRAHRGGAGSAIATGDSQRRNQWRRPVGHGTGLDSCGGRSDHPDHPAQQLRAAALFARYITRLPLRIERRARLDALGWYRPEGAPSGDRLCATRGRAHRAAPSGRRYPDLARRPAGHCTGG